MPSFVFLPFGRFGDALEPLLARSGAAPAAVIRPGRVALPPRPDLVVTAASTSHERVRSAVEAAGIPEDVPWLPVLLEPAYLSVGPLLAPGVVCLSCFRARQAQHDGSRGRSGVAQQALETLTHEDPWPFLPTHARIAAGLVTAYLGDVEAEARRSVLRCRLDTAEIGRHPVIPLSGCAQCRGGAVRHSPLASVIGSLTKAGVPA